MSEEITSKTREPGRRKLRIAMFGTRGIPHTHGGLETFFMELAPRLAERGHEASTWFYSSDFRGNIDLFLVDGAHSYDYVRADTERALECCHAGSVVLWHDYGRNGVNGVSRYLNQLAKTREVYRLPGSAVAMHLIQ
ncbi:MAG TPA: class I SAM-dependent methyltransferase [Candidatus Dormibacteraeota bacterium]|nr:class I SAM-dependent methyltransferase [Candidatus Dormibacteraeota bacterium]